MRPHSATSTLRSTSIKEKGIDLARIELRTGGDLNRSLDNILVPTGASFAPGDTNTFDSNSVKRQGQPYAMPKTITSSQTGQLG
jgi:hypothetical protein